MALVDYLAGDDSCDGARGGTQAGRIPALHCAQFNCDTDCGSTCIDTPLAYVQDSDGSNTCDVQATCGNTDGGFDCDCNSGWGNGASCVDVDECAESLDNCDENTPCNDEDGVYTCGDVNVYSSYGACVAPTRKDIDTTVCPARDMPRDGLQLGCLAVPASMP